MARPVQRPTLEEFLACCDAACSFLVGEYGFERSPSPPEGNPFSVRFQKGELGVEVCGENYGESASCDLMRGEDRLGLGSLVPAAERGTKKRSRSSAGQLEHVRVIAEVLQRHATDFLRGDLGRFELALAEWRRITRPRPVSDAHRQERERQQALTAAGHASKRADHAAVVRLLEPYAAVLSPHQRRMLETAREKLRDSTG